MQASNLSFFLFNGPRIQCVIINKSEDKKVVSDDGRAFNTKVTCTRHHFVTLINNYTLYSGCLAYSITKMESENKPLKSYLTNDKTTKK